MPTDPRHNEFTATKKVIVGLIIIQLVAIMFAYMTTGGALGGVNCTNPQASPQCQMQNLSQQVNTTSQGLLTSFTNATTTPLKPVNPSGYFAPIINIVIVIPNGIYHILLFIYSAIALIGYAFYIIIFIMLDLIPSLFSASALGIFAPIFSILYSGTLLIVVAYAIYIILNRLTDIKIGL